MISTQIEFVFEIFHLTYLLRNKQNNAHHETVPFYCNREINSGFTVFVLNILLIDLYVSKYRL